MRCGSVERKTLETEIFAELNLDGTGICQVNTGIGFFDHMLTLFAKHSFSDLTLKAVGDLDVDSHHTVEDCGIVLGQALKEAIGDKAGIYEAEMTEEFFRAVAMTAGITLHIRVLYGKNTHHIIEAMFKGFARALAEAVAFDSRVQGVMSSKGLL